MCELMGMSFERRVNARFSIRAFGCRDEENPDGWGLAWYPDQSVAIVKEANPWRKSVYSRFLEDHGRQESFLYLAHVRKKSTGGPATHADTHPFMREHLGRDYCFAHNGTIQNHGTLQLGRFHPVGMTDSERLFCHLLERLDASGQRLENLEGWQWLHRTLREVNHKGTMNLLISDGARLFAYRDLHGWKGLAVRKARFKNEEARLFEDALTEVEVESPEINRGVIVASRPLSETGWHEIPLGGMIVAERGMILHSFKG